MKTVKTMMDEETYAHLVAERKKAGVPSVSALFLLRCGVLTDAKEASEIVRKAIRAAKSKKVGYEFRLRDLFSTAGWNAFSKGARLRAGKMFHEEVAAAIHGLRASRKSSSNHQYYIVAS
ncbi:single-stranded DNA-binding protein [Ciceribacter selenitireducens]